MVLVGNDRAAGVAARGLADDDAACSSDQEDGVGSAGEAVDDHRSRTAVSAGIACDDADCRGFEVPTPRQPRRVSPSIHGDENRRNGENHRGLQFRDHETTNAMKRP